MGTCDFRTGLNIGNGASDFNDFEIAACADIQLICGLGK